MSRWLVLIGAVCASAADIGANTIITLDEFPNQKFRGKITRTSDSIDLNSRTLNTEVDVDNPTGQLLPGAYVTVHLKLPGRTDAVTIPSNTLLFRSAGLQVGVVQNGRAQLVSITIGRDYGATVEVVAGLKSTDAVIVNPSDSLISGQLVRISTRPEAHSND